MNKENGLVLNIVQCPTEDHTFILNAHFARLKQRLMFGPWPDLEKDVLDAMLNLLHSEWLLSQYFKERRQKSEQMPRSSTVLRGKRVQCPASEEGQETFFGVDRVPEEEGIQG
jgi:hypothetical protein